MFKRASIFFCLVGMLLVGPAQAGEVAFELSFGVDKNAVTIGDEVVVSIDILHGEKFKLKSLAKDLDLTPFEIKHVARLEPETANFAVSEGFRITLTIFHVGTFTLPAIPIHFTDPDGNAGIVHTQELPIQVNSVGLSEEEGSRIRPIHGPKSMRWQMTFKQKMAWVVGVLLALLLIILLLAGLYFLWRFATKERLTFQERAVRDLKRLKDEALLPAGRHREYYTRLSDIVKTYLVQEWCVGSMDLTSRQYLIAMDKEHRLSTVFNDMTQILNQCDFVKFAKLEPERSLGEELWNAANRVVAKTIQEDEEEGKS